MNSEKTPHTSPLRASYGASFLRSLEKRHREISRAHCSNGVTMMASDGLLPICNHHDNVGQSPVCHTNVKSWLCFYQTRSAWSVDQGSNKNHSPAYNFAPTVTKFCVMWEGLSLPHGTKFGNCRCKIVDSRAFPSWSLIHGLCWSGLIKAEPGGQHDLAAVMTLYCIIWGNGSNN